MFRNTPLWIKNTKTPCPTAQNLLCRPQPNPRDSLHSKGLFDRLVKLGIAEYFEPELVISSSEKNLHKPDIRIFELALEKSGDSASESVMVGDRIDNDVKPAKQLGMKSIRIKRGIASSQQAPSAEYEADFTIKNLYELDGILDKMQRE